MIRLASSSSKPYRSKAFVFIRWPQIDEGVSSMAFRGSLIRLCSSMANCCYSTDNLQLDLFPQFVPQTLA